MGFLATVVGKQTPNEGGARPPCGAVGRTRDSPHGPHSGAAGSPPPPAPRGSIERPQEGLRISEVEPDGPLGYGGGGRPGVPLSDRSGKQPSEIPIVLVAQEVSDNRDVTRVETMIVMNEMDDGYMDNNISE